MQRSATMPNHQRLADWTGSTITKLQAWCISYQVSIQRIDAIDWLLNDVVLVMDAACNVPIPCDAGYTSSSTQVEAMQQGSAVDWLLQLDLSDVEDLQHDADECKW
jgi:hypothetical protein